MSDPEAPCADAPTAPDETLTRRAIARYAVLDTPPDPAFDEIVDVARRLTGTQAGGIGFLDRERVWFKSHRGLAVSQAPRAQYPVPWGSCGSCRSSTEGGPSTPDGVIVLRRAFTLGEKAFAFWASVPIVTGEGYHVAQLFVLDERALSPAADQLAMLGVLARQVMAGLELRRTMMSYRAAVDGAGHVVFQLDDEHRLLSVTPTWGYLTGFGVVRSVGRPFEEFIHAEDRAGLLAHLRDMHDRNVAATFECRLRRLLGGDRPVEIIAKPVIDEAGAQRGLVGVIADISERKAREIEARHAQKLEALGRLSSGLAHEINTPIQFVGDNTRFLADGCAAILELVDTYHRVLGSACATGVVVGCQDEVATVESRVDLDFLRTEIPSAIQQTLEGIERVAALIQAMRTFSRTEQEPRAGADLNEALRAAVTVARTQVQAVARIDCQLTDIPCVTCSIGDLNQVFLNMIVNAADAIEEKGEFGTITVRTWLLDGDVVIEIADTGTGIPPDIRQQIFEPFFTTKDVGRGTGQGLALARAVVQDKHGGTISVDTQLGTGTTFTVRLPVGGRSTG